jgi:3-oxoacyl-[acyl-carrier-protein] synthase II
VAASDSRRVALTGVGLVTPLAIGTEASWAGLVAGRSGAGPLTRFDASGLDVRIAAEVKDFEPERFMPAREVATMDRFIHFALAAAAMAIESAGLDLGREAPERMGCYIGVGLGGSPRIEASVRSAIARGPRFGISPFFVPAVLPNMAAGFVSQRFGLRGPSLCHATACAAGAHAIGEAFRAVRGGEVDVMICGGAEASLNLVSLGGFAALRALSQRNDDPAGASRPFDRDRDGFVMGEGAGLMVLEPLDRARARGARVICELRGYALTSDASHPTAPPPDGHGAARCMRAALADARLDPREVDYINAHGTGTRLNDAVETAAIKAVFGDHARRLMVGSTKSMTGHLLGAAGGVEAAICALALDRGVVPPTINHRTPDPECDLDCVPNEAREVPLRVALSNSFGFGGTNAVLVLASGDS